MLNEVKHLAESISAKHDVDSAYAHGDVSLRSTWQCVFVGAGCVCWTAWCV